MKKWIVGYWEYKNDQWEDKEKEALANTFDEVLDVFRVFTPNAKIRYIYEVNNFTEKTTEGEYLKAKKVISKYNKENNNGLNMTPDEKISYVNVGLRLVNIELHKNILEKVIKIIEVVDKKKGNSNIMDFIKIEKQI